MINIKHINYEIISTYLIFILGSILHFTYEWSNDNIVVGIFSSINESTWEHLKLLFFPMLISTIIGYFMYNKEYPNYLCSKVKGILIALLFIIIFFYTYTGIIGRNFALLDIGSFFSAAIIGQYCAYKHITKACNTKLAIITLILLISCFIKFTFSPPHINLFKDPITNTYGIQNNP